MNSKRLQTVPALIDSVLYRFGVATIALALGALATPTEYGFFAAMLLPIGFFQACVEGAIRGSSSKLFDTESSRQFVLNFSRKAAILATPVIVTYGVVLTLKNQFSLSTLLMVSPLFLTPLITVYSAWVQRLVQLEGKWSKLASVRVLVTSITLPCSLLSLFFTDSLLAAALFLPVTELALFFSLRSGLNSTEMAVAADKNLVSARREIGEFIPFQARFWMINQADRLIVGILGSPHVVGLYLLASAIARLPVEITTGTLNTIFRNKLRSGTSNSERLALSRRIALQLRLLNTMAIILSTLLVGLFLSKINQDLNAIVYVVPLLMSPIFLRDAASIAWTSSIHDHGVRGKSKTQLFSILTTITTGVIVSQNFVLGSIAVATREILTSCWILWRWRSHATLSITLPSLALSLLVFAASSYLLLSH